MAWFHRRDPRDHRADTGREHNPYWEESRDIRNMGYVRAFRDNRGSDPNFEPDRARYYDRNYNEEYGRDFNYRFEGSDRWDRMGRPEWSRDEYERRMRHEDRDSYGDNHRPARYYGSDRGDEYDDDWRGGRYRGYRNIVDREDRERSGPRRYQSRPPRDNRGSEWNPY